MSAGKNVLRSGRISGMTSHTPPSVGYRLGLTSETLPGSWVDGYVMSFQTGAGKPFPTQLRKIERESTVAPSCSSAE